MPKGIILEINPGYDAPEKLLEQVIKEYPNAFGGAIHTKEDGKDKLLISLLDSGMTLEELRDVGKQFHDCRKTFFFGDFPKGYSGSDIQPFVVLENPVGTTAMVAFMEGDFEPSNTESKTEHSNEYFAFDDMLKPTLQDVFESEAVDKDIDKLINVIDHDKRISKTLNLMCGKRGTVTLMAVNGAIRKPVAKNELAHTFPWGTISNHLGYEEKTEVKEKKGFLSRAFGTADKPKETEAPLVDPTKAKPERIVEKPKTETVLPARVGVSAANAILHERESNMRMSDKLISAPIKLAGKPLKNWLHNNVGYVPQNWNQHGKDGFILVCRIAMKKVSGVKDEPIKSFADPALKNAIGGEPAAATPLSAAERLRRRNALKAANQVVEEPKKEDIPEVRPLPSIIPKKELEGLMEWQKRFTGCDGVEIVIDPEVMVALNEEVPDYAEQTGRKGLEFVFHMSRENIRDHRERFPEAMDILFKNVVDLLADAYTEKAKPAAVVEDKRPAALRRKFA